MRHLGLNRMRTKADLIDANELTPDVAEAVFIQVRPIAHREDGEPLYLESAVDRAIEMVRSGNRPSTQISESIFEKEDLKVNGVGQIEGLEGPWNRIADSLEQLLEVFLPRKSAEDSHPNDVIYTTTQAAKLLHRHVDVVRQYCRQGVFGIRDAGGKWVIRHSEIEKFRTGQLVVRGKGVA